ncbi:MAG: hypothetical protein NVS9B4_28240 [Candidatus Acidiferrum sp.]
MPVNLPKTAAIVLMFGLLTSASVVLRGSQTSAPRAKTPPQTPKKVGAAKDSSDALRFNTLGVAYMNQQRSGDAQKLFEQALEADPNFAVARLNLGVCLLNRQKLQTAVQALTEAAKQLPSDPYAWYNLGLAYKNSSEEQKAIDAFQHVTEIVPDDPGAYYFIGYLYSQLGKYDQGIAAFQKALKVDPNHASSEFGLARDYQRKGDAEAAREHLTRFQKITSTHIGTPVGGGYGDQGRLSVAELPPGAMRAAPPAIPVHFTAQPVAAVVANAPENSAVSGASTGACFFDYDGDG